MPTSEVQITLIVPTISIMNSNKKSLGSFILGLCGKVCGY